MKRKFFRTKEEFTSWLEANHDRVDELWLGMYKKGSGRPSITWPEAVDVALRFGWIDGVRRGIDEDSYENRFTPRRPGSNWSLKNILRVKELIAEGVMHPAGLEAFEGHDERTARYSYEQIQNPMLDPDYERELRRNKKAWSFFQASPPSYRKAATHWVMSAKRDETRRRRLAMLIDDSSAGERVLPLRPPAK